MNEIVTFAESLVPLISELRHTTENDRRIAEPIVQAIRKSDLCRMLFDAGAPSAIYAGRMVECPRDVGGRRSVGFLVHLEQRAALFLVPLP